MERRNHALWGKRAGRAALPGAGKGGEACGLGSEVSHCLCSDIALPYGSHQQLFFPLMPQLELDQGRSQGPWCEGASEGQERQRHRHQHHKKGDLSMESLQKTGSTWQRSSAIRKTYLPSRRRLALSAVIGTAGTGVWERLLMVS